MMFFGHCLPRRCRDQEQKAHGNQHQCTGKNLEESAPIHDCEEPFSRRGCSNGTQRPESDESAVYHGHPVFREPQDDGLEACNESRSHTDANEQTSSYELPG